MAGPARGSRSNPPGRFDRQRLERLDPDPLGEGLGGEPEPPPDPRTAYLPDATRSAIARNSSPDVGFEASLNPYRGCEHGCVYCLGPDTPILHADHGWRPIGEARPGDVILGFDEHCPPGHSRKLRPAVIQAVWWSRRPTLRLITPHTEIVTTAEHRWLRASDLRWWPTEKLGHGPLLRKMPLACPEAPAGTPEPVEAIEPGPVRDVVDIQTSTGTFLAAGLATHNCYARPTHEYLGYSAGLDFETRILVKPDAPELLRRALSSPRWKPTVLALSGVTDPYQPVERKLRLTRRCLAVLAEFCNPVSVITKSYTVTRDADLLAELAALGAASVSISITTLDGALQRRLEPRASAPGRRLAAIERLAAAGVPVGVMVAPIIPGLTDHEIPAIVEAAARAGASFAGRVVLRLPHGVKQLFDEWLAEHCPERREKVLSRLRALHGVGLYDPSFGVRQRGAGPFAEQIGALFELARRRAGLADHGPELSTAHFRRPGGQLTLF